MSNAPRVSPPLLAQDRAGPTRGSLGPVPQTVVVRSGPVTAGSTAGPGVKASVVNESPHPVRFASVPGSCLGTTVRDQIGNAGQETHPVVLRSRSPGFGGRAVLAGCQPLVGGRGTPLGARSVSPGTACTSPATSTGVAGAVGVAPSPWAQEDPFRIARPMSPGTVGSVQRCVAQRRDKLRPDAGRGRGASIPQKVAATVVARAWSPLGGASPTCMNTPSQFGGPVLRARYPRTSSPLLAPPASSGPSRLVSPTNSVVVAQPFTAGACVDQVGNMRPLPPAAAVGGGMSSPTPSAALQPAGAAVRSCPASKDLDSAAHDPVPATDVAGVSRFVPIETHSETPQDSLHDGLLDPRSWEAQHDSDENWRAMLASSQHLAEQRAELERIQVSLRERAKVARAQAQGASTDAHGSSLSGAATLVDGAATSAAAASSASATAEEEEEEAEGGSGCSGPSPRAGGSSDSGASSAERRLPAQLAAAHADCGGIRLCSGPPKNIGMACHVHEALFRALRDLGVPPGDPTSACPVARSAALRRARELLHVTQDAERRRRSVPVASVELGDDGRLFGEDTEGDDVVGDKYIALAALVWQLIGGDQIGSACGDSIPRGGG